MSCAWTVFDSWMNDRGPEFAEKAVAIIELLLNPPTDGPLYYADEKTGIGVRMPAAPDQRVAPGRAARREFEYVRNGTVDLLGWLLRQRRPGVQRGAPQHRSPEFCELLYLLDTQTPAEEVIHLIVDPVSLHRSAEVATWLANRLERIFKYHFLPIHGSWLSFIEVWFSILTTKCLVRANFPDSTIATHAIDDFMATYNLHLAHLSPGREGSAFTSG